MSKPKKDLIGPIFKGNTPGVVPEGPTAEHSSTGNMGMMAAKKFFKGEQPKVEGTPVKTPLPFGPPSLPPGATRKDPAQDPVDVRTKEGKKLTREQLLGNTHIGSLDSLLANDRMEKPRIQGWSKE